LNNEPKSSLVCLTESAKLWDEVSKEMSPEEKADCEKVSKVIDRKTQMEKQNTNVIGNINDFAFLKGGEVKPVKAAPVAKKAEILPKYDWYQN
jgi:hypothetical protein